MRASAASLLIAAGLAGTLLLPDPAVAQGFGGTPTGQPRQLFPQPHAQPGLQPGPGLLQERRREGEPTGFESAWPLPDTPLWPEPETQPETRPEAGMPAPLAEPESLRPGRRLPSEIDSQGPIVLRGGIEVDRLGGGLMETAGPLQPAEGGLGLDLWSGSDRDSLVRLLAAAPRNLESPALRDLAVRLLLSSATPPSAGGSAAPGALLRARVALLRDLGAFDGLRRLLQALPRDADDDPELARVRVEAALLQRDRAEACREARAGIERFPLIAFWQEALIYCQISEGEEAAANIGLALLREAGDGDPELLRLAEAALGLGEPPEPLRPEPLVLAYLAALDRPPPPAMVERAPAGLQPVLARQSRLEPALRLQLAESAADAGALRPRSLAEIYERERFSSEELLRPLQAGRALGGPRGRALLYKGAWRTRVPDERAALLGALHEEAAAEGLELAALRVAEPLLLELAPSADLIGAAPLAVRSLLLTGRLEASAAWIAVLRSAAAAGNPQAQAHYAAIWPLARVAGLEGEGLLDPQRWAAQRAALEDPLRVERELALLRNLLGALEEGPIAGLPPLLARVGGVAPPSPAALYGLRGAAAAGRRGETVLYSLLLLGEGPPGQAHPEALAEVAGALATVGLGTEARAIAVESLLLQGF